MFGSALRKSKERSRTIISVLVALALAFTVPIASFANEDIWLSPVEQSSSKVPKAESAKHVHNMPGWECTEHKDLICGKDEHSHSKSCYALSDDAICGKDEGEGGHEHTDACYKDVPASEPTEKDKEDGSAEGGDTDSTKEAEPVERELACGKSESKGHVHDPYDCFAVLDCDENEHSHSKSCYDEYMECSTEFDLLTVEFFVKVDGQQIRVAENQQLLLPNKGHYSVKVPDLSEQGYEYNASSGLIRANGTEEDSYMRAELVERDGGLYVEGDIAADTLIEIDFGYSDIRAPYQGSYWGTNAQGDSEELIYAFTGQGIKDTQATLPANVSEMLDALYDALGSKEMKQAQRDANAGGKTFAKALAEHVSKIYGADIVLGDDDIAQKHLLVHDITPLLDKIAADLGKKAASLTRVEVKQAIADTISHAYGMDANRSSADDDKVQVTADGRAEKNFYYKDGEKQSIIFQTGFSSAEVKGIPTEKIAQEADEDGIVIDYDISLGENYITSLAGVDISGYTKHIYAQSPNFDFVGWHTDDGFGVIDDYTADNAGTKYRNLKVYKPDELAGTVKEMPSASTNFYAVWNSKSADYIVQLWFESTDEEGTYIESHSYDMKRTASIGDEVWSNAFDRERADESAVAAAANGEDGASFPVSFTDNGKGGSGKGDIYYNWSSFASSPFYGFDLLDCRNNSEHSCPKHLVNKDGSTSHTEGNACNCEGVTVGENGETVLNVFYTREMWEVKIHPAVEVYQYNAPTDSFANVGINYDILASGGRLLNDLVSDASENDGTGTITLTGKYGTPIPEDYLDGGEKLVTLFNGEPANINENILDASGVGPSFPSSYIVPAGQEIRFTTWVNHNSSVGQEEWNKKSFEYDIVLNFNGLTSLSPESFSSSVRDNTAGGDDLAMVTGTKMGYSTFGSTSNYNLSNNNYKESQYGSRTLDLYPSYINTNDAGSEIMTYNIDYFVQPLPGEETGDKKVHTYSGANGTPIEFVKYGVNNESEHTVSFQTRSVKSKYSVDVPEGFTALMWRSSATPITGKDTGDYGFTGINKIVGAYEKNSYQMPPHTTSCNFGSTACKQSTIVVGNRYNVLDGATKMNGYAFERHNAGFGNENIVHVNDSNMYLSDWKIWYIWHPDSCSSKTKNNSTAVAYYDPTRYWIGDWVRTSAGTASMDGSIESYNALMKAANNGDKDSIDLLAQLRNNVVIGDILPANVPLANPYPAAWDVMRFTQGTEQPGAVTSVAFARNKYNIRYNSCYLNSQGDLVRDDNGNIVHDVIHSTADEGDGLGVYYEQELGYNPMTRAASKSSDTNYYNARFTANGSGSYKFLGYDSNDPETEGGYGKWFLDPDGTIEFNEENLATMPAGDVDVYYHYAGSHYNVYFVDDVTGTFDYKNVDINGTKMNLSNVLQHQAVAPNKTVDRFDDPVDADNYFVGWYYDREGTVPFNFDTPITEDLVLYAVWQPKVKTQWTVKHILIHPNGDHELLKEDTSTGYVGDTVDASALGSEYYEDGMYFEPDYYSSSMFLKVDAENNVMEFYYRYAGRAYTVEYRDIRTGEEISGSNYAETQMNVVTVKYEEIPGWHLVSEPYITSVLNNTGNTTITFWYEQDDGSFVIEPGADATAVQFNAAKLLDHEIPEGERFEFVIEDGNGEIVARAKSVDGSIAFEKIRFENEGTYNYVMREVATGNDERIKYDLGTYEFKVDVKRNSANILMASVEVMSGDEKVDATPVFNNETEPVPDPDEPLSVTSPKKEKVSDAVSKVIKKTEVGTLCETGDRAPVTLAIVSGAALAAIVAIFAARRRNRR